MTALTDGTLADWRAALDNALTGVVRRLKDRASSSYYSPSSHGSPWESAKLAGEEADVALAHAEGETWEEFCDAVRARLVERRESFRASDGADPDGYVCNALNEIIDELCCMKDGGSAPCPQSRPATPSPWQTGTRSRLFLAAAVVILPVLAAMVFVGLMMATVH